jgi:hypothetical protein
LEEIMIGVLVVYAGLVAAVAGVVTLIRPLRWLRVRTRKRALGVLGAGVVLVAVGMLLPAQVQSAESLESLLDEWMPAWQFSEFHSLRVRATPEQSWRAIQEVTADEIWLFRTLTWIRNPHWPGTFREGNIMNPSAGKPILDEAMAGGFVLLGESAEEGRPREIVLGTVVLWDGVTTGLKTETDAAETQSAPFASLPAAQDKQRGAEEDDAARVERRKREWIQRLMRTPGNAVATINFRVRDEGGGWCSVTTETRVFATDLAAQRQFARYWRVIYPGSSLLRYTWLRAIRARAETD